jgi:hypothetical protein
VRMKTKRVYKKFLRNQVARLAKDFSALYRTRRFIAVYARISHVILFSTRRIQPASSQPTSPRYILITSSHLCLGLPSGLYKSHFLTRFLYAFTKSLTSTYLISQHYCVLALPFYSILLTCFWHIFVYSKILSELLIGLIYNISLTSSFLCCFSDDTRTLSQYEFMY